MWTSCFWVRILWKILLFQPSDNNQHSLLDRASSERAIEVVRPCPSRNGLSFNSLHLGQLKVPPHVRFLRSSRLISSRCFSLRPISLHALCPSSCCKFPIVFRFNLPLCLWRSLPSSWSSLSSLSAAAASEVLQVMERSSAHLSTHDQRHRPVLSHHFYTSLHSWQQAHTSFFHPSSLNGNYY